MSEPPQSGAGPKAVRVRAASKGRYPEWESHLRAIAAGEAQSLEHLYDASSAVLFGLALRMLRDRTDAEEALADVYAHVWRSAGTWDPRRGSGAAWLVMLCRSRCLDRMRARASRRLWETPLEAEHLARCSAEAESIDGAGVRSALARLRDDQRRLLEAAFYSGLTHEELAQELGLPLGTVKTRIRAAIAALRNLMKEWLT